MKYEVITSFDDNYIWPFFVHLFSGQLTSKINVKRTIITDANSLSPDNRNLCEEVANWLGVSLQWKDTKIDSEFLKGKFMSKLVYSRLLLADELDYTFTFLDVDTILLDGWDELFTLYEMFCSTEGENQYVVLAALDGIQEVNSKNEAFHRAGDSYFNAGVMIINPILWRKKSFNLQWKQLSKEYHSRNFEFDDQDILNFLCYRSHKIINQQFNQAPMASGKVEDSGAKIIHYKGLDKPWKVPYLERPPFTSVKKFHPGGWFPLYWDLEKKLIDSAELHSKSMSDKLKLRRKVARRPNDLSFSRMHRVVKSLLGYTSLNT